MPAIKTDIEDKVKVLKLSGMESEDEIEREVNNKIKELNGNKVLSISSSLNTEGQLIVMIHYVGK